MIESVRGHYVGGPVGAVLRNWSIKYLIGEIMVYTDKERDTPADTFDTVRHEGRFQCWRESESTYRLHVIGDRSFRVTVRDGGKKVRIALMGIVQAQPPELERYRLERSWPQAVNFIEIRTGGFHLERLTPTQFFMGMNSGSLHFNIVSGPKRAFIVVEEAVDGG